MFKNSKKTGDAIPNQVSALERRFGPIEYRQIDALAVYDNNPRQHPESQLVKLTASITEFGFTMPALVDESDVIIAGEARIAAAQRAGLTEVPVIVAHHWSSAQVQAYRLADNRLAELASWDEDSLVIELAEIIELDDTPIEILGWETAEIDLVLECATTPDEGAEQDPADEQPEDAKLPISREGDLWQFGKHRLFCGSSLDTSSWTKIMAGETAAMVFIDSPYNVPVSGHVCGLGSISHSEFAMASGEMTKEQFTEFLTTAIAKMSPHLKDGAVLHLCMDWRHMTELLAAIEANGLALLNLCVWNKTNGGMGSFYRSKHELVFVAKKGKASHMNNVQLGKHGRYRTNVWDYPGVNSFGHNRTQDLQDHPTVKPVALVADAIRDVSKPGEIILDGFLGSGTTILAAERTKRRCFGIEIEPGYVDVAIRRWEKLTGREAVLESTGQTFAEVAAERSTETIPDDIARISNNQTETTGE